jgi:hypothetical protein
MFKKPNNVDCLDPRTLYPGGDKEMSYTVSLLTNSALVQYMSPNAGVGGEVAGSQPIRYCLWRGAGTVSSSCF